MDMINLENYPLDCPETTRYRQIVAERSRELAQVGLVNLENFLTREGTLRLVAEIKVRMPESHFAQRRDNPYSASITDDLPDDHPYRILSPTERYGIAFHQMRGTVLEDLYRWPPLP